MGGRLYCDKCAEWIIPLHGVTALYERDAWWCAKHCSLTADGHVDFPSAGRLVPESIMTSDEYGESEPLSDSRLQTMRRGCDSEMDSALDEITRLRASLNAWEEAAQHGHPSPCNMGPLCPYCEIDRLRAENEQLKNECEAMRNYWNWTKILEYDRLLTENKQLRAELFKWNIHGWWEQ